jgi:Ca2+-binding EF-hand superfamily protein
MATSKNLNADNLKNLRRQPTMGADVMHLDDDKDFDPNEKDKDSDDEAHAGAKEGGEREAPGSKWDGPTASETLAAAEAENFNRHDEDRAKSNILKMREAAKAKVGALGVMGSKMDEKRVLRISNETLDFAIRQLASEDWRTRKVATYDFMDEVMTRTKASREAKDDEATKFYFEKVEKYVIPLFSDENWWVRKAAIRGVVKLSLDDPRAAQEAVVESIPHGDTYKGRWTACRAALRMYDAARSADKAEESMRINILHAMLELLDDDHWIVRQEVLNALDQFANFRDVHVISKALKILPHQEPKVRQTAVTILNQFIDPDGKHDSLSNKQVAQKMIDAGLTDQESFEALDDNGNGRLSAKELRAGLKDMLNVIFSVPRIKTFLGELANKDMRFEEFNTVVEKHHAEPAVTRPPVADFYAAKKALDKEGTATLYKDFRKNGKKMMMDLLNDLLNKLPVDYNLVPWVTSNLQVALRKERDWICKDRLFEGYVKMVQFHDPQLPFVLCELLLDKRNSGKLCNLVASQILEVADVMGDHYTAKGSIGIYCHEWMDMTDSPPTQETRGEEQKGNAGKQDGPVSKEGESSAAHAPDLKRCSSRRGRGRIEEGAWDICEVMVEKLYNPNVDMQLAAARCLVRFWDR